jgi:two-component system chemotaxis sensor kinase CheA
VEKIIREFLAESSEAMDRFDVILLAMEKDGAGPEELDDIFRIAHSLKGACGYLAFPKLGELTHAGESLLSRLRDGKLAASAGVVACLFRMGDAVRGILRDISATGAEGEPDIAALAREMEALGPGSAPARNAPSEGDWSVSEPAQAAPNPSGEVSNPAGDASGTGGQTIRVDVALLDKLMNMVGELVLVRNQVLQQVAEGGGPISPASAQQLDQLTSGLQEGVMRTRMQPIKNVWGRFPRLVRDISLACGKNVRLEMEGGDTGMDKTVLEAIKDPLTHVLRNSIDHGIEAPAARIATGKHEQGAIRLKAYQKGGKVHIEISDDGAGIDVAKVACKALDKGLLPAERIAAMTDWELAQLVFLPGFSTAEAVTNLSGRGVGMDVVKNHVEKIGGTVDLASRPGEGLTVRIKIPLTLAIIPALIVQAAGQRFAIPQANVLEVVRLKGGAEGKGLEWAQDHPVYRLRGELLPLLRMEAAFKGDSARAADRAPAGEEFVAVVQADHAHFGILLASVRDTQEIVVKPLGKHLKAKALFSGATIMGDGKVALILDVPGLAQAAGLVREPDPGARPEALPPPSAGAAAAGSLLLAELPDKSLFGFPLADVLRIEDVAAADIVPMGGREAWRHAGRLVPIARLGGPRRQENGLPRGSRLKIILFARDGAEAGIAVERILDIAEGVELLPAVSARPGVRGAAIVHGRALEIMDPSACLDGAVATVDNAIATASGAGEAS